MTKQLKHPQERTVKISLNQQQLDQIIHGLTLLNTAPMNTVDPHYDSTSVFFVSTKETLELFTDLNNSSNPVISILKGARFLLVGPTNTYPHKKWVCL